MKPIFTVILSTLGVTLLCGLAFVINLDAAIKKEASKYSKADYAMMTKTVSFPGSVEKLHVATGLDADYYVKDTTGIKVIVTCTKGGMEKLATELKDGQLNILFKGKLHKSLRKGAHITIIAPAVPQIELSSGAELKTHGAYPGLASAEVNSGADLDMDSIVTSCVEFDVSSGADADVNVYNADTISADVNSGASLTLGGNEAKCVILESSSGASLNAKKIKALSGKATASSGGSVSCNVKNLKSKSSSGGSVKNVD